MRYHAVTAVRVDGIGRITHVVMDLEEPGDTDRLRLWSPNATEYDAKEVANIIAKGNVVETVFLKDSGRVYGPLMRRVEFEDGDEGIELAEEVEGYTYRDLIQLGE